MGNLKLKVLLYILSLWLLFFSLFIMSWDSDFLSKAYSHILGEMGFSFSLYEKLKTRNYVFLLSLLFMFIGFLGFGYFYFKTSAGWSATVIADDVSNENHEHLEFLTTYVMPLVFTDVNSKRTALNLLVMIIAIGAIYIRTNKFYSNP
ncbi:TPA: anti-phage protein KwaA, partial [Serratia marcescens]